MAAFRYRALTTAGAARTGIVEEASVAAALESLRRSGLSPVEVKETRERQRVEGKARWSGVSRRIMAQAMSELAVLLGAGLTLDRALGVIEETVAPARERKAFAQLRQRVIEGAPLSRAMAESGGFFPPLASAMAEAGEFDGRLDRALARLGDTLERNEALRQTISAAMVYPALLLVIAVGVILMMLLWVIPQFEGLFDTAGARLPPTTRFVMALSDGARRYGLLILAAIVAGGFAASAALRRPAARAAFDRRILRAPAIGPVVLKSEIARFARVLGSLLEGGVALPEAVLVARATLGNIDLAERLGRVAEALRQGRGLTVALTREAVFPAQALSFVRTGEETATLGSMLGRLADGLDRDVRMGVERLIAVLTPLITVVLGGMVAAVIASVMTAILGFNDLALSQ